MIRSCHVVQTKRFWKILVAVEYQLTDCIAKEKAPVGASNRGRTDLEVSRWGTDKHRPTIHSEILVVVEYQSTDCICGQKKAPALGVVGTAHRGMNSGNCTQMLGDIMSRDI